MDLLNGKIKPLYFKCLSAAFGSGHDYLGLSGRQLFPAGVCHVAGTDGQ